MSVRMRHTKGHTGNRRSHHALKAPRITQDTKTGSFHLRHRVDVKTGMYRGRKVLEPTVHTHAPVETKKAKTTASKKEKATKKEPK